MERVCRNGRMAGVNCEGMPVSPNHPGDTWMGHKMGQREEQARTFSKRLMSSYGVLWASPWALSWTWCLSSKGNEMMSI